MTENSRKPAKKKIVVKKNNSIEEPKENIVKKATPKENNHTSSRVKKKSNINTNQTATNSVKENEVEFTDKKFEEVMEELTPPSKRKKNDFSDILISTPKKNSAKIGVYDEKNKDYTLPNKISKKSTKKSTTKTIKEKNNKKIKNDEHETKIPKTVLLISDIVYWILFIFIVILIIMVSVQKFSGNELTVGGYRFYNISTESMLTKYEVGDILLAKDVDPSELKVGDDIAYNGNSGSLNGKIVTHEIQSITKNPDGTYKIVTKGLMNDISDPEISADQIKGKIIKKLKILSFISKIINNNATLFFAIFLPFAILIFISLIKIRNEEDEE